MPCPDTLFHSQKRKWLACLKVIGQDVLVNEGILLCGWSRIEPIVGKVSQDQAGSKYIREDIMPHLHLLGIWSGPTMPPDIYCQAPPVTLSGKKRWIILKDGHARKYDHQSIDSGEQLSNPQFGYLEFIGYSEIIPLSFLGTSLEDRTNLTNVGLKLGCISRSNKLLFWYTL